MPTRYLLGLAVASVVLLSGCESLDPCAGITSPALRVRVLEAGTSIPVAAGAALRIAYNGVVEVHTFPNDAAANDDTYESTFDEPGVYDVEVSKTGYVTTTSRYTVNRAACNRAMSRTVSILLPRADGAP